MSNDLAVRLYLEDAGGVGAGSSRKTSSWEIGMSIEQVSWVQTVIVCALLLAILYCQYVIWKNTRKK